MKLKTLVKVLAVGLVLVGTHVPSTPREAMPHKRVLTALSPCSAPASCRLWPSVRTCIGSLCQPSAHGGFLTPATPWTTAEKAMQTG
jgi:hypothetical protein